MTMLLEINEEEIRGTPTKIQLRGSTSLLVQETGTILR
jgi:hypothetical protein